MQYVSSSTTYIRVKLINVYLAYENFNYVYYTLIYLVLHHEQMCYLISAHLHASDVHRCTQHVHQPVTSSCISYYSPQSNTASKKKKSQC